MIDKETKELRLEPACILRSLSSQDFLNLGVQEVAYIKPVQIDDHRAYAIHAADGTPLLIMESEQSALNAIEHNDLQATAVH